MELRVCDSDSFVIYRDRTWLDRVQRLEMIRGICEEQQQSEQTAQVHKKKQ